ncbi:MAG TPA: hypothetical protein VHG29_11595 [Novosphingobium sp.]|nr:hypothetical protein [Novosphingobium sp.]
MKRLILLALPFVLSGCITYHTQSDGITRAHLGETVVVDGPRVTPLTVLEDSRCPTGVQCVWAGQVRLTVRIDLGSGSQTRDLTSGKPERVADGTLELVEVMPERKAGLPIYPEDYRFGFKFAGGL